MSKNKITRRMMVKKLHIITEQNWRLHNAAKEAKQDVAASIYRDIATLAQAIRMFSNGIGVGVEVEVGEE